MKYVWFLLLTLFLNFDLTAQEKSIGIEFQNSFYTTYSTRGELSQIIVPLLDLGVSYTHPISKHFAVVPRIGLSYMKERNELHTITYIPSNNSSQASTIYGWGGYEYFETYFLEYGALLYYHIPKIPELSFGIGPVMRTPLIHSSYIKWDTSRDISKYPPQQTKIDPQLKFEIAHSWRLNNKLRFKYAANYSRNFGSYIFDHWRLNRHYWGGQAAIYFIL